jgi:carbon storage regulator
MLVLSRKVGEKIRIGKDVEIEITRLNGNRVQIGITAPPEVHVRRMELEEFEMDSQT